MPWRRSSPAPPGALDPRCGPRWGVLMRRLLLGGLLVVAGCAAAPVRLSGVTGPVAWHMTDVQLANNPVLGPPGGTRRLPSSCRKGRAWGSPSRRSPRWCPASTSPRPQRPRPGRGAWRPAASSGSPSPRGDVFKLELSREYGSLRFVVAVIVGSVISGLVLGVLTPFRQLCTLSTLIGCSICYSPNPTVSRPLFSSSEAI